MFKRRSHPDSLTKRKDTGKGSGVRKSYHQITRSSNAVMINPSVAPCEKVR